MLLPFAMLSLVLGAEPQQSDTFRPSRFQSDGWVTICWTGTDGLAANCEARKSARGFLLRLAVSDSQFVQSIEHGACRPSREADLVAVPRDSLFASSKLSRQRLMRANFLQLAGSMTRRCRNLARLRQSDLGQIPDLAMAGGDDIR